MPVMCWHEHDFENDPGYRATGIPPDEITCPVCCGEGCAMFDPYNDWGCKTVAGEERACRRYLKVFSEDGRCRVVTWLVALCDQPFSRESDFCQSSRNV